VEVEDMLEDLADVVLPILNTKDHHSAMDIVKWLTIFPVFVNIINNKTKVWRDTGDVSGRNMTLGLLTKLVELARGQPQ
jgi:hypothetical protein